MSQSVAEVLRFVNKCKMAAAATLNLLVSILATWPTFCSG